MWASDPWFYQAQQVKVINMTIVKSSLQYSWLRPGSEDGRLICETQAPTLTSEQTNKQTKQKQYAPQTWSGDIQICPKPGLDSGPFPVY